MAAAPGTTTTTAPLVATTQPTPAGVTARPGVRVELAGTAHHVRALERQPDGTYKNICTDAPEALHPAANRGPGGGR